MAVMKSRDDKNYMIVCCCGCDEGIRFEVDRRDDLGMYFIMTYTNGSFYREQGNTLWKVFRNKLKKIWAIVRNKDYYYSEVCMTKEEFNEFREYIDSI